MNKTKILLTIFIFLLSSFSFLYMVAYKDEPIYAQSSCPSDIDPDSVQCLNYLNDQLELLKKQEGSIQKQLKNEEYQQLSLQEKIEYTNNQIAQTEKVIKSLEVEIAASDVEIKLLEKSITEKEDNISLLKQEIRILEKSVTKRVTESYKYSFVGPLELFLDMQNLSNILRKTKYLAITRSQDKKYLEAYGLKVTEMKEEERLLTVNKSELQTKRNSIETEKITLAESRQSLSIQKVEKERLLAESKIKQAELLVELKKNKETQAQLDAQLLAYINAHMGDMKYRGSVQKGDPIGTLYPSASSCSGSTGPHLHFGIDSSNGYYFYANVDIYKGGYLVMGEPSGRLPAPDGWTWNLVHAGKYAVPLLGSGAYITQDYHELWPYNQKQDPEEIYYYATDLAKLSGSANATVLAADSGELSTYTDHCNQDYAIIKNLVTGYRTIYVHLAHRE